MNIVDFFGGVHKMSEQVLEQYDATGYAHDLQVRDLGHQSTDMFTEEAEWLAEFGRALADDEFVLYYQPIVSSARRIIGVEALLRWLHPTKGLIAPNDFIPVAERTGMIVEIGEMVLRKACQQTRRWSDAGIRVRVNVNISIRQIQESGFVDMVKAVIAQTGVDPLLLQLELTESLAFGKSTLVRRALRRLSKLGIAFSLDDIGTDYAALKWIMDLSLSTIKLDRSLTILVGSGSKFSALVKHLHGFAQDLGIEVVAEGVETTSQATALTELGCEQMQGYLFGKPMPADEVDLLLRESHFGCSAKAPLSEEELERDAWTLLQDFRWLERCTLPAMDHGDVMSLMATVRDLFEERFQFDRFGILVGTMHDKYCVIHEVVTRDDMQACPEGSLMIVKNTGLERVYQTGQLHYNPDISANPEFLEDPEMAKMGLRSFVRIPLIAKGEVFGVMTVKISKEDYYTPRDLKLMEMVASRLSSSIYSLRLIYSLREASYKDALTGAFNRRFLSEVTGDDGLKLLAEMAGVFVEEEPRTSVIFVDLDKFKGYNDVFGHLAGDALLTDVANMLKDAVQDDGFVVRYGGDEFAIVLPETSLMEAHEKMVQIRDMAAANLRRLAHGAESKCTLSMGISEGEWRTLEEVIATADGSMYEEKRAQIR